jgi:hypothetical protein
MRIEVYTLAHQEARLIPYVMRHYEGFKVIAYAGHSTDGTEAMLESLGAEVRFLNTNNESNDGIFQRMKNECWKDSKADWVIVTDFDELVYCNIPLEEKLKDTKATLIRPMKAEMYSESFPTGEGKITDLVKTGVLGSAKFCLFRPSEIKEMNFDPGCHNIRPEGNVIIDDYAHDQPNHIISFNPIMSLHYRNLGKEYVRSRQAYTASRLSKLNRKMGWGLFVLCPWSETEKYFDDNWKYVKEVI